MIPQELRSRPRQVQWAISVAVFMVPFMGSSMNLALPQLERTFSLNALGLTLVVSSYLIATAMLQAPAARLADLYGRRRMFLWGLLVFGLFALLSGLAWSGPALVAFRFLTGIGSAMVFSTNMAILAAVFPPERRGRAFGINTAVVYAAAASGPLLGGMLAQHWGWRSIYFASAAMAAAAWVAGRRAIQDEWAESRGEPFDARGSLLYALALAGVVAGCSLTPSVLGTGLLLAGGLLACVFVRTARRRAYPVIDLELFFARRRFRLAALSAMINYAASFAIAFLVGLYLQYVRLLPERETGLVLVVQPIAQTLLSPLAGRWSDRIDPSYLTTAGMLVITGGLAGLCFLTPATPLWLLVALLALIGVGFGLFSSPNVNLIMGAVDRRHQSLASATTGTVRLIGQSLSMAVATMAIHVHLGTATLSRENGLAFMPSLKLALQLCAALCLLGVYASAAKLFRPDEPPLSDAPAS